MRVTHESLANILSDSEMYPTSSSVGWCLLHELYGLLAVYKATRASERAHSNRGASQLAKALQSIRFIIIATETLVSMSEFFQNVNSYQKHF